MSGKRWATSRDANELEIVKALRKRGAPVYRIESTLDPGVCDLLCEVYDAPMAQVYRRLTDVRARAPIELDEELRDLERMTMDWRRWVLLEVKDRSKRGQRRVPLRDVGEGGRFERLGKRIGQDRTRLLSPSQAEFFLRHLDGAPCHEVETVAEALRACGLEPETGETE